ncbi:MAG: HAD-IIB family hydrolase [Bacilli bacterium]|nr:HAD-IIB family hydrolase [Bacilli bacterium]
MRIIASDFDETLLVKDHDIFEKNVKAIDHFISKGNIFVIITGRLYTDIKLLLNKHNIHYSFLICQDGAKILNEFDYSIKDHLLPKEKIDEVIKIFDKHKLDYYLDDGYNITTNKNDCIKINSKIRDREEAKEVLKEIKDNVDVYAYLSRSYINIIDSNTSKSIALEYLMYHEDFNKEDIYVIGDDVNDYEMLSEFNGGVMTKHNKKLDSLNKKEFDTLYEFIEYVENN